MGERIGVQKVTVHEPLADIHRYKLGTCLQPLDGDLRRRCERSAVQDDLILSLPVLGASQRLIVQINKYTDSKVTYTHL